MATAITNARERLVAAAAVVGGALIATGAFLPGWGYDGACGVHMS